MHRRVARGHDPPAYDEPLHFLDHSAVDQILVMDQGRVVERGRFAELLENTDGRFSEMMRSLGGARGKQEAGSPEEDTAAAEARETRRASTARAVLATSDANVAKGAIVKREAKREGAVTFSAFRFYFRMVGRGLAAALALAPGLLNT